MGKTGRISDKIVLFPYKGARDFVLNSRFWEGRETLLQMLVLGWLPALKHLYDINNYNRKRDRGRKI